MYHVTRQSFGVCKLYTVEINEIKYQEILIYIFNFYFFNWIFRFYLPLIESNYVPLLNILIISLIIISLGLYYFKFKINNSFYPFVTGIIIFIQYAL